jgi:sugar-specific transcriptional regulator TrmB
MNQITHLLNKYGLSDRDSRVYLHLLSKMEDSVLGISKATNIPRTTVYSILTELKEQNLISSFRKNKVQFWTPESVNQLKVGIEQKQEAVNSLIPLLRDITSKSNLSNSSIRLFTGKDGLKTVWEDIIFFLENEKPPFVYAISHTDLYSILPKYFPAWIERRRKSKVFAKLIVHNGHKQLCSDMGQEVRSMPEKYVFTGDLTIYGNKVAIFIFEKDKYEAIIIDSPAFTQMIQGIFNYTWDNLGESSRI